MLQKMTFKGRNHVALVTIILLILGIAFRPTLTLLFAQWSILDQSLSHGFPVMIIFLWACYAYLPDFQARPLLSMKGILLTSGIVLSLVLASISQSAGIEALAQLAIVGLILCLFLFLFPDAQWLSVAKVALLPLFVIQPWEYFNDVLLHLSSVVIATTVGWLHIPTLIDGSSITLPYGLILIADGCSGLRYFIIAGALAWVLALFNHYSIKRSILTLCIGLLLGLLTNWIRIFIIILVAYYTEMKSPLIHDHEFMGWVLFAVICFPALYFAPHFQSSVFKVANASQSTKSMWILLLLVLLLPVGIEWQAARSHAIDIVPSYPGYGAVPAKSKFPFQVGEQLQSQYRQVLSNEGVDYELAIHTYPGSELSRELVPYLPRFFSLEDYTLLNSEVQTSSSGKFGIYIVKRKFTQSVYLLALQYDLGLVQTTDYKKAKLWQILPIIIGSQQFRVLTVQTACLDEICTLEMQGLREMFTLNAEVQY